MKTDEHYDAVARELLEGRIHAGVWARALADSNGNNEQAKAIYIRHRVTQMTDDETARKQAELAQSASALLRKLRPSRQFVKWCLILFGVLILTPAIGVLIFVLLN